MLKLCYYVFKLLDFYEKTNFCTYVRPLVIADFKLQRLLHSVYLWSGSRTGIQNWIEYVCVKLDAIANLESAPNLPEQGCPGNDNLS